RQRPSGTARYWGEWRVANGRAARRLVVRHSLRAISLLARLREPRLELGERQLLQIRRGGARRADHAHLDAGRTVDRRDLHGRAEPGDLEIDLALVWRAHRTSPAMRWGSPHNTPSDAECSDGREEKGPGLGGPGPHESSSLER